MIEHSSRQFLKNLVALAPVLGAISRPVAPQATIPSCLALNSLTPKND